MKAWNALFLCPCLNRINMLVLEDLSYLYLFVWVSGHMYVGASGVQKRVSAPLQLELQAGVHHLLWVLKISPGPLKAQYMLLTMEISLQPLDYFLSTKYSVLTLRLLL